MEYSQIPVVSIYRNVLILYNFYFFIKKGNSGIIIYLFQFHKQKEVVHYNPSRPIGHFHPYTHNPLLLSFPLAKENQVPSL